MTNGHNFNGHQKHGILSCHQKYFSKFKLIHLWFRGTLGGGTEMTNGHSFNGPERERSAFSCRRGFIVK